MRFVGLKLGASTALSRGSVLMSTHHGLCKADVAFTWARAILTWHHACKTDLRLRGQKLCPFPRTHGIADKNAGELARYHRLTRDLEFCCQHTLVKHTALCLPDDSHTAKLSAAQPPLQVDHLRYSLHGSLTSTRSCTRGIALQSGPACQSTPEAPSLLGPPLRLPVLRQTSCSHS